MLFTTNAVTFATYPQLSEITTRTIRVLCPLFAFFAFHLSLSRTLPLRRIRIIQLTEMRRGAGDERAHQLALQRADGTVRL